MSDNTKSDPKPFLKELLLVKLPHKFVRTSFLFLFRPHSFFNEVKANNWDAKLHPAAFLLASLLIVAILNPFIGLHSTDPTWYESATEMDDERFLEFLEAFQFTSQELEKVHYEVFFPDLTPASRRIEETVGSLKVSDIGLHLARENTELARAFAHGADKIKKYYGYFTWLLAPVLGLSWAIGALIIHPILRQALEPYRLAFYLLIYHQGFWLAFAHLVIAFGHLVIAFGQFAIPYEFSSFSLLFLLFEGFAYVACFVHGSWIVGFVYNRGIGRRLLAYFLACSAVLVTLFVYAGLLYAVVDHLP